MIKRIVGILGSLGVVAIVIFAILGRKEYSSAIDFTSAKSAVSVGTDTRDCSPTEEDTIAQPDSIVINEQMHIAKP